MTDTKPGLLAAQRRHAALRQAAIEVIAHWDKLYTTLAMELGSDERFSRLAAAVAELRRTI